MLVLSRKVGERIVIDDKIVVVVSRVEGDRVSVGIEAPRDIHILRGELKAQWEEAAANAARPSSPHAACVAVPHAEGRSAVSS